MFGNTDKAVKTGQPAYQKEQDGFIYTDEDEWESLCEHTPLEEE